MKHHYYRLLAAATILFASLGTTPALASGSTQVSELIGNGLLSLSAPSSASLSSTLVSFSGSNVTTGSLGQIEADDGRGSYAGWSLMASASNFVHIGQAIQTNGPATILSTGGSYASSTSGAYTLTITTGGSRGTAQFVVSGLENQTATTIPASDTDINVGTRGVLVDFPDTTYQVGESWRIPVSIIPANDLTIQPSPATTRFGDLSGIHTGAAHTFSSSADSATLMSADVGSGTGAFLTTPTLNLQVPPLSASGFYFATITETLN